MGLYRRDRGLGRLRPERLLRGWPSPLQRVRGWEGASACGEGGLGRGPSPPPGALAGGRLPVKPLLPQAVGKMTAERGYWSSLTPLQKVAVVLGIPASATVLYILYRRYQESRGGCCSPRAVPTHGLERSAAFPPPDPNRAPCLPQMC